MFRTTSSSIPMTAPCTSWRTVLIANSRGAASRTTRNAPRRSPGSRRQLLYSVGTSDARRPMMITPSVIIARRVRDLVGTPHEPAAVVPGPLSRLPGTLYLVQDSPLYRLRRGVFTAVDCTQPALSPGTRLRRLLKDGTVLRIVSRTPVDCQPKARRAVAIAPSIAVAGCWSTLP